MCLSSITPKPHKAEHDIVCYKQYYVRDNYIIAPCTRKLYKYKKDLIIHGEFRNWRDRFQWFLNKRMNGNEQEICAITDGFIHVYKNRPPYFLRVTDYGLHTYKCIIPQDTLYYLDNWSGNMAARKIKIIEKIS